MTDSAVFHDSVTDDFRDATGPITVSGSGIPETLIDAKGDLIVGAAADDADRLPVGATDGHVLTVDAASTLGVKWAAGGGGGPTGAAGGVLDGTYPNPGLAAGVAGAGLVETTNVLSIDWGEVGDLVAEAIGSTASAGVLDEAARADHRHAMPSNADVETAYNAIIAAVTQAEAEAGTSTSILRWTPQRVAQAIAALGFAPNVSMQVKTDSSGTYTPTTGMVQVLVICVGGGGGAPAATGADEAVSGGGAGGAAIKLFSAATIGASQAYAVGQTSTAGGNTSGLGTANALLQATGGAVGVASGNLTLAAVKGGQGGVGTLGDLNIRGGSGYHAAILSTAISHGGNGGNSIFGGGGRGGSTATTVEQGEAGGAYGGGAGGGKTSDGTDLSAVAGAAGVIYFIEFLKVGGGAGAAAQPGASELIYRYTVTGADKASIDTGSDTADAGSLDWTNGNVLEVHVYARSDEAAATSTLNVTVNNDATSIYDLSRVRNINTTVSGATALAQAAWAFLIAGASAAAGVFSTLEMVLPNYSGTVGNKAGRTTGAIAAQTAGQDWIQESALAYRSTAAITRLKIAFGGAQKLKVGSQLLIYKRRST